MLNKTFTRAAGGTAVLIVLTACQALSVQVTEGRSPIAEPHPYIITGSDASPGTQAAPLRTIQRAADLAQPGDTVTVHAGVYRERANPTPGPFEAPGTGTLTMKVWPLTVMAISLTIQGAEPKTGPDTPAAEKTYPTGQWRSEPPTDCPFKASESFSGVEFSGRNANYTGADT
jgi:hypothetical protein